LRKQFSDSSPSVVMGPRLREDDTGGIAQAES
jgi:hypothetical protein